MISIQWWTNRRRMKKKKEEKKNEVSEQLLISFICYWSSSSSIRVRCHQHFILFEVVMVVASQTTQNTRDYPLCVLFLNEWKEEKKKTRKRRRWKRPHSFAFIRQTYWLVSLLNSFSSSSFSLSVFYFLKIFDLTKILSRCRRQTTLVV